MSRPKLFIIQNGLGPFFFQRHKNPNFSPIWDNSKQLGSNPPSASRDIAIIPLGSKPERRLEYLNYRDTVRFGQILEDLDTFAGNSLLLINFLNKFLVWLAYKHNQPIGMEMGTPGHHPMLIVTACVDRIGLLFSFYVGIFSM